MKKYVVSCLEIQPVILEQNRSLTVKTTRDSSAEIKTHLSDISRESFRISGRNICDTGDIGKKELTSHSYTENDLYLRYCYGGPLSCRPHQAEEYSKESQQNNKKLVKLNTKLHQYFNVNQVLEPNILIYIVQVYY